LVVVDPKKSYTVNKDNILYKCGWSPFDGTKFNSKVIYTFVNGKLVFDNGKINEAIRGKKISFE
jgi:dihydroorotase